MSKMKEVLNKSNKKVSREELIDALDIGLDFKINARVKEKTVTKSKIKNLYDLPIKGESLENLLDYFQTEIIPYCTNFGSEKFMSFPDSGNSVAAIAGSILSDFLQQNLINETFCAPIATYIEIAVIKWLREVLGYNISKINNIWDVGGIITYGGTGSNASAMLLARENFVNNTMEDGITDPTKFKVIVPKGIGHYSIRSSLMWIGCGNNVIEVETENFKYNLKELEKTLIENKGKVMAVVSYVGDSRTQTIEDLELIHNIVKKIDSRIWLHADACHGFSLAFSDKLKTRIKGIELFDSISTDPHKVMITPYCLSALLIKDPAKIKLITSASDLIMQEDFAFGQVTPFIGSKSWVSLKLWFMIKNLGIKKIGEMIEKRCEMAEYLGDKIKKSVDFILLNEVNINSVVFMYVNNKKTMTNLTVDKLNKLNLKLHDEISNNGEYHLHKFPIPDNNGVIKRDEIVYPLRYMSGNPNITKKDIDLMLDYVRNLGQKIFLDMSCFSNDK